MSETKLRQGDIGTALRITVMEDDEALDISAATSPTIRLKTPSNQELTKTATIVTDEGQTKVQYVTVDGDLDEVGRWIIQAHLTLGSWTGTTEAGYFTVENRFGE